jgi:hypothetical protein
MKNNLLLIVLSLILVTLLVVLTNPFSLWMTPLLGMMLMVVLVVALFVWAGFIIKEKSGDEREAIHRMNAGRIAYLAGIGVLTVALLVQGLTHTIDPWISLTLGVMILSKLFSRLYSDTYK